MNNFLTYITPQKAYEINQGNEGDCITLKEFIARSKVKGVCSACKKEEIWRYGGMGMCFTCTTGEWNARDDYELIEG